MGAREASERLKAHALSALTAVAPATIAWYFAVDRRHRSHQAIVLQTARFEIEPAWMWRRYLACVADADPFTAARVESYAATVLALKDFEPESCDAYRAYLADQGLADRADVYLFNAGTIVAQFALLRAPELGPFSTADLSALRRMQPLLEHAFACTLDPEQPTLRPLLADSGLSEREMDVAELVARGATNQEIARSLHISEATVKTHLTRVYSKVGVRTRTQLALSLGAEEQAARTTSG
ncbi:helix-turn-helix transcriptional regulator [Solirubrobacter phytolaccae]|uniref:helix-turn-helix transcriptional regulator n=1 Tax=Solirubrobacter phytolaccae TaxID=1404360 RepID=UPI0022CDD41B|nr:helix-turn-helix transcriptional regulator [Solirubrobacter phytolaccae]